MTETAFPRKAPHTNKQLSYHRSKAWRGVIGAAPHSIGPDPYGIRGAPQTATLDHSYGAISCTPRVRDATGGARGFGAGSSRDRAIRVPIRTPGDRSGFRADMEPSVRFAS
jgi:hypothetical protein